MKCNCVYFQFHGCQAKSGISTGCAPERIFTQFSHSPPPLQGSILAVFRAHIMFSSQAGGHCGFADPVTSEWNILFNITFLTYRPLLRIASTLLHSFCVTVRLVAVHNDLHNSLAISGMWSGRADSAVCLTADTMNYSWGFRSPANNHCRSEALQQRCPWKRMLSSKLNGDIEFRIVTCWGIVTIWGRALFI